MLKQVEPEAAPLEHKKSAQRSAARRPESTVDKTLAGNGRLTNCADATLARTTSSQRFGHAPDGARGAERQVELPATWRRGSESNRPRRICNPLHNLSATPPWGASHGDGIAQLHGSERSGTNKKGSHAGFPSSRPYGSLSGAGNETRTRDLNLGKVALYQLSYSRTRHRGRIIAFEPVVSTDVGGHCILHGRSAT